MNGSPIRFSWIHWASFVEIAQHRLNMLPILGKYYTISDNGVIGIHEFDKKIEITLLIDDFGEFLVKL
jgi:hypothetical protein